MRFVTFSEVVPWTYFKDTTCLVIICYADNKQNTQHHSQSGMAVVVGMTPMGVSEALRLQVKGMEESQGTSFHTPVSCISAQFSDPPLGSPG